MDPTTLTDNHRKLKELLLDVLLLTDAEFRFDLLRPDCETWDSLAVVAIAAGVEEVFGYHFHPEEATSLGGVADIIRILESRGISFRA